MSPGGGGSSAPPAATSSVPSFVRRLAAELRVPAGRKVAGVLADASGNTVGPTLANGSRYQHADNQATLQPDGKWRRLTVARAHVEGHAAGIMRERREHRDMHLVITQRPCEGDLGCDAMLPALLPAGSRLTVWVRETEGAEPKKWRTYPGTGEGVL
ncbi:MAG: DddA-like double-stranded DNA deaminase toxin [Micromonosporaceae bacterium]